VKSGDLDAFGVLYERYLDPIYRYIATRVSDEQDAEDLTEHVFLRSFESLHRYEDRGLPYSAFLYRVARNVLIDHYRSRVDDAQVETAERVADKGPSLDERVVEDETQQRIERELGRLPEDYQEVIRMRILLDLPTDIVAGWLDRSEGAVRILLHRALKTLRENLSDSDF
jgi:RNA polymerase sigma-70 factor (ECF subfamily)